MAESSSRQVFTKEQLARLYDKAASESERKRMNTAKLLYRNKQVAYFDGITHGDGIMRLTRKDFSGDPCNPVNGGLNAVSFGANVEDYTQQPPSWSPYGPKRFLVPLSTLLEDLGPHKIYFSDFYCMNLEHTTGAHYVTLVLCKTGSDADVFCESNLIALPENNPFFKINDDGVTFAVSSKVWLEIFYTECINIVKMLDDGDAYFDDTDDVRGTSSSNGIPKNPKCPKCNLQV